MGGEIIVRKSSSHSLNRSCSNKARPMVDKKFQDEKKEANINNSSEIYNLSYLKVYIPNTSERIIKKIDNLIDALSKDPIIEIKLIKSLALKGIPSDHRGIRSITWKLMLKHLPANRKLWKGLLRKNKETYEGFAREFLTVKLDNISLNPEDISKNRKIYYEHVMNYEIKKVNPEKRAPVPLSKEWLQFLKNLELWDEVEKDTKRTRAEMNFFVSPVSRGATWKLTQFPDTFKMINRIGKVDDNQFPLEEELHHDVLTRILFIYAKLNPSIAYVQGMNEILAILYYCFANDINEEFRREAEVDAFFCFTMLMGEIKDGFEMAFDMADFGIYGKIRELNDLLKRIDPILWNHLSDQGVKPEYYSLRWILLMLTQELEIGEVLILWDSLFAMEDKNLFLLYVCVSILVLNRESFLAMGFSDLMERLQKMEISDVFEVLSTGFRLYQKYSGKPVNI